MNTLCLKYTFVFNYNFSTFQRSSKYLKCIKKIQSFQELEEEVESVDAAYAQLLKSWQSNTQVKQMYSDIDHRHKA